MDQPPDNAAGAKPKSTIVLSLDLPAGEKPGDRISHYKLLTPLGEGGMGTVWLAEQEEPVQRRVALKLIKLGMDTKQVIGRFEAERQALALMDHPGIAKVLDGGATANGRPFFVMELVRGIPITEYCDQEKLDTQARLKLFVQVCQAIQHAHQRGIIHRDIKPSNILVTHSDSGPVPKIIDFGIAKAMSGQKLTNKTIITALEQFIGTPAYMSPEQAEMNALDIDARSDVYALGVLLYELLTGKTPFEAATLLSKALDEIRRIIREEEPPKPSTRLRALARDDLTTTARCRQANPPRLMHLIRGDLDWIVMKTLEKDRTRRYRSASDLADDIARHLRGEIVTARAPGFVYWSRKLVRRHRPAFMSTLAVLLLAVAGAVLLKTIWPGRHARATQLLENAANCLAHYDQEGMTKKALDELADPDVDNHNSETWALRGWAHWLSFEDGNNRNEAERLDAFHFSSNSLAMNPDVWLAHLVQGLCAINQSQWSIATNELWQAKKLTKDGDGLALISLAAACQDAGDVTNARYFSESAERVAARSLPASNAWMVFDRQGVFQRTIGEYDRSFTNFQEAVQLAPADPLPHLHLGQAWLARKDVTNALAEMNRSLNLRATASACGALGTVYFSQGKVDEAAPYFSKACDLDPASFRHPFNLALCLRHSSRPGARANSVSCFQQALEKLNDTLDVGGNKAQADAYRGACLAGAGQAEEARRELAQAEKEAGNNSHYQQIIRSGYEMLAEDAASPH